MGVDSFTFLQCYKVLQFTVLYSGTESLGLFSVVQYNTVKCCSYHTLLLIVLKCFTMFYNEMQYFTMQYFTVLCSDFKYCTVL